MRENKINPKIMFSPIKKISHSMFIKMCCLILILLGSASLLANNLKITGVAVDQSTQLVTFTLSWENSWYLSSSPNNWDAVWVFVKFRQCSSNASTTASTHGTLSSTLSNHSYTNLEAMTSVTWNGSSGTTGSASQGASMDFTDGIMLRRSATGSGSLSSSVSLKITNLPASGTAITLNVFGIEMVYVPTADFSLGDGNGTSGSYGKFGVAATAAALPMSITSSYETGAQTFYTYNLPTQTVTSVPAAWPKGNYGFYIMKYEISQGQYCMFLNDLITVASTNRYPSNYTTNRNRTYGINGSYSSDRPDRAQNYLSWDDVSAYLDWACLRPLTESEYEKACRGTAAVVNLEYAWGSTSITAGLTFTNLGENGSETFTTASANCTYNNQTFVNGDATTGPARVGIYATPSSNRVTAGASFYGVLDLTGNVREYYIGIHSTGASNTFTRTWGDGSLDANGRHDVGGGWPAGSATNADAATTNIVIDRGGSWNTTTTTFMNLSSRYHAYNATNYTRINTSGGRGGR